ncbi:YEY2 [Candida oxycetoniae]|uniref:YEY2 n=1 Tax=Candida oxycetoniae TaxID=497107 RepID=A0AAI9SXY8_9ASCO|nr:YEY2 [Candida oxycetoniae]KAI3405172.2 YEY2 [Candida oxycetoniae]
MSINFFKGHPTRSLLPAKEIAHSYNKVLLESNYLAYDTDYDNQHPLAYGTDPGNLEVRDVIASWVNKKFNIHSTRGDLINLTSGASYGIANLLTSVTSLAITRRAFIVTPTYFLINNAFVDVGLGDRLTAINETAGDEYEIDLNALEKELIKYSSDLEQISENMTITNDPRGERKLYSFVLYLVPTFSNPGGTTYSLKTRLKLLELARKFDLLIISDDVYEYLDYSNDDDGAVTSVHVPIPKISQLDQQTVRNKYGNSISNATFSKIIAPGLRCGWQESATPALVQQLSVTGANKSGGTPAQLATLVVAEMIKTGELDTIIENFVSVYKERAHVLKLCVEKYLPENTKVYGGDGGYFFWIELPHNVDNQSVIHELAKKGVILAGGENFEVYGDKRGWGDHCVRLSISYLTTDEIQRGIKQWGETITEVGKLTKS